jgi:VCBS repeat-containing protein
MRVVAFSLALVLLQAAQAALAATPVSDGVSATTNRVATTPAPTVQIALAHDNVNAQTNAFGAGTLTVTLVFSEDMDPATQPGVGIDPGAHQVTGEWQPDRRTWIGTYATGEETLSSGTNTVSVMNSSPPVSETFTADFSLVSPTTNPATNVLIASATLQGTATPAGWNTTVHFQYDTTSGAYTQSTTPQRIGNGEAAVPFSADLTELRTSTTYFYRAAATTPNGTGFGEERSFTTGGANQPPLAADDAYAATEDHALTVVAPGVLGNDSDAGGDTLTAVVADGPSSGALTLNADGSFTYTPDANANGPDSFTYRANDGTADSNVARVTITVAAVNDPPSFTVGPDQIVAEDAGAQIVTGWATAISAGPADEAGQTLTFSVIVVRNTLFFSSPRVSPDGTLRYTPEENANGSSQVVVGLQDDGGTANGGVPVSASAIFTITVTAVNDAPTVANAVADQTVSQDAADLVLDLAGVFADVDIPTNGDSLTLAVGGNTNPALVTATVGGTSLTLEFSAGQSGAAAITIRAADGAGAFVEDTFQVTVNAANAAPVAASDAYGTPANVALNVSAPGVLGNDTDPDGHALTAVLVATTPNGSLTLNADGSLSYAPNAGFSGVDTFTYKAKDATLESNVATVTITVAAAPTTGARRFHARLDGSHEVPAVSSRARGAATLRLGGGDDDEDDEDDDTNRAALSIRLGYRGLRDVTAAHLHLGPPGANGAPVVNLCGASGQGSCPSRGTFGLRITAADLRGPLAGMPLNALLVQMEAGNVYVNVHTSAHPDGEIRGQVQVERPDDDEDGDDDDDEDEDDDDDDENDSDEGDDDDEDQGEDD